MSDARLLRELLDQALEGIRRIERRCDGISSAEGFLKNDEGLDRLDGITMMLFATLEDAAPLEAASEAEEAWLEEAERRYQRYVTGETISVPASKAIERVRSRLRHE